MDEINNPYTPGAGSPPPTLVGRDDIITEANTLLDRTLAGRSAQSILLTGLRGVGKTVLLNRVKLMALDKQHVSTIQLEIEEGKTFAEQLVPELLKVLYDLNNASRSQYCRQAQPHGSEKFYQQYQGECG